MPWVMRKMDGGKFAVYKQGQDGEPVGEALGTHDSEAEAKRQLAALYANADEPGSKAVKFAEGTEDIIEGPGMPFGGCFNGRDLDQQFFSAKTDFAFGWFPEGARPLLFHHGLDGGTGTEVVGRVKSWETQADVGIWTRAQLDKSNKYFQAIKDLIAAGKLFFSSGAMAHLVQVDNKTGEIKRWPWVELSLTPTPANLLATVDLATAEKHFKAAGLELPDDLKAAANPRCQDPEPEPVADLKAMVGSFEALKEKLDAAINPHNPFASSDRYAYIQATFPDYFIAELYELGEKSTWRVAYTVDETGNVALGQMTPVEQTFVPVAKAAGLVPEALASHTELVTAYAAALAQRTQDLSERRLKEGRVLSNATRSRLSSCLSAMRAACDEMSGFLDQTDPAKVEAKAEFGRLALDIDLLDLEAALSA